MTPLRRGAAVARTGGTAVQGRFCLRAPNSPRPLLRAGGLPAAMHHPNPTPGGGAAGPVSTTPRAPSAPACTGLPPLYALPIFPQPRRSLTPQTPYESRGGHSLLASLQCLPGLRRLNARVLPRLDSGREPAPPRAARLPLGSRGLPPRPPRCCARDRARPRVLRRRHLPPPLPGDSPARAAAPAQAPSLQPVLPRRSQRTIRRPFHPAPRISFGL
jgi:hypothetical protein